MRESPRHQPEDALHENPAVPDQDPVLTSPRTNSPAPAPWRTRASALARKTGLYSPLRTLYNTAFFSFRTHAAAACGVQAMFRTPTNTLREHVEELGGEPAHIEALLNELRDGDLFWDIGAAFGLYTVLASVKCSCTVIAFEPSPQMRRLLERNLALNHIKKAGGTAGDGRVSVCGAALGDHDGFTELFEPDNPNPGTSALIQRKDFALRKKGVRVEMRRGDSIAAKEGFPAPTVVKIDVEGAEARVLEGLGSVLKDGRLRAVFCEVHPRLLPSFGDGEGACERLLGAAGFSHLEQAERGTEYHVVARR